MNHPAGSAVPPPSRDAGSRHHLTGRVVWISFAISAALHVLAIVLYSLSGRIPAGGFTMPVRLAPGTGAPEGIQVVRIVETNQPTKPATRHKKITEPTPVPHPVVQPGNPSEQGGGGTESAAEGGTRSAAERLRPAPKNRRLWAPVDPAMTRLTAEQRMSLALAGRLEAWRDSVMAADSVAAAATDWTFTDKEGHKWGVTPGALHLGGLTLPLPFNFGTQPGHRGENERRTWEWNDIQRQTQDGAVRAGWKERAKAIRERRDKERAAAKADSSGGKH